MNSDGNNYLSWKDGNKSYRKFKLAVTFCTRQCTKRVTEKDRISIISIFGWVGAFQAR